MSVVRVIEGKPHKEIVKTSDRNGQINEVIKKNENLTAACSRDDPEREQINDLLQRLPELNNNFDLHRKIGEGTFSTVYLGSLKKHTDLPEKERRLYAIKHLVPTAHPARVEHELRCLRDMGGKENVIGVDLCLRHLDTVVFVMPYIPHRKFSEYVGEMDGQGLRRYLCALLRALRHVHSFGVIHRDVKPSNFLYDHHTQRYLLVDFGLAQRLTPAPPSARVSVTLPDPAAAVAAAAPAPAHKRPREEDEQQSSAKRVALDLSLRSNNRATPPHPVPVAPAPNTSKLSNGHSAAVAGVGGCACWGVGGVCGGCGARAAARAPRAGTQGFRPPEVLLKYSAQGTGVDVWAAGVVCASALCARYPLLRAADDAAALAELAELLGTQPLQRAAHALQRRLIISRTRRGLCLRKLCARLRQQPGPAPAAMIHASHAPCRHCKLSKPLCLCRDESKPAEIFEPGVTVAGFPDSAFALAARMLDPDPHTRISAADALNHAFFTRPDL